MTREQEKESYKENSKASLHTEDDTLVELQESKAKPTSKSKSRRGFSPWTLRNSN